jgi:hypothetical protein
MGRRVSLRLVEGRLVLPAVISSSRLRVQHHLIDFVIDTGSSDSFLSEKDVKKIQVPIAGKAITGEIDFGGSRFKQVQLPKMIVDVLDEGENVVKLEVSLTALKTTKVSEKKTRQAETLPSLLGLGFLKEQRCALHVIMQEELAYLEFD